MTEQDWARPVVSFEIRGRDAKRLREFYAELFHWKIAVNEALGVARAEPGIGPPENGIGGVFLQGDTPGVGIYVQVRDLRETLEKAVRLGGKKVLDPVDLPAGPTIARIQDPEGNFIGLVQQ
jgi:predicted enzyme related to lactoylglutathione lyase